MPLLRESLSFCKCGKSADNHVIGSVKRLSNSLSQSGSGVPRGCNYSTVLTREKIDNISECKTTKEQPSVQDNFECSVQQRYVPVFGCDARSLGLPNPQLSTRRNSASMPFSLSNVARIHTINTSKILPSLSKIPYIGDIPNGKCGQTFTTQATASMKDVDNSCMNLLCSKVEELLASKLQQVAELRTTLGKVKIGEITVGQVLGGMRDMIGMNCETSQLDANTGITYRGLSIPQLLEKLPGATLDSKCPYTESVLWLLLTGEVPTAKEAELLSKELATRSSVPQYVYNVLDKLPTHTHPMTQYVVAIAALQTESIFRKAYNEKKYKRDTAWKLVLEDALNLIAKNPLIVGYIYRRTFVDKMITDGKGMVYDPQQDYAANVARMVGIDTPEFHDMMRLYIAVHADHEGGNVSAHSAQLIGSALSDPYFCFAGALAGLSGPLHGLANQECLSWLKKLVAELDGQEINVGTVTKFAQDTLKKGYVIPGYGHAVLRVEDPRHTAFVEFAHKKFPDDPLVKVLDVCLQAIPSVLAATGKVKNPHPNVDCSTGVLLSHFGLTQPDMYTVFFGISRAVGIMAQLVLFHADKEEQKDGRLRKVLHATNSKTLSPVSDTVYCESVTERVRFPTRNVRIGNVTIGGNNPIALQTMTSCDTCDTDATVEQIIRCQQYGAAIVRLAVQSPREVRASVVAKEKLLAKGCNIPLVADIHYSPKVALMAAEIFDKVRVNPGNYVDGRKDWEEKVYNTEEEFREGTKRIEERFTPLVEKCKELKRAIRIGTNHGSLSSRIMSYYGDSPKGMVMSAIEFAEICVKNDFHDIVFSMKSSNSFVMVNAYRLLVNEMYKRGWNYPIHLGVTEAGSVDDGRIKSCIGIGAMLIDGIGDTIRLSLTEDPWLELPPGRQLLRFIEGLNKDVKPEVHKPTKREDFRDFNNIMRRELDFGVSPLSFDDSRQSILNRDGSVGCFVSQEDLADPLMLYKALNVVMKDGLPQRGLKSVDFIYVENTPLFHDSNGQRVLKELIEGGFQVLAPVDQLQEQPIKFAVGVVDLDNLEEFQKSQSSPNYPNAEIRVDFTDKIANLALRITGHESDVAIGKLCSIERGISSKALGAGVPRFIILDIDPKLNHVETVRRVFGILVRNGSKLPVVHKVDASDCFDHEEVVVNVSTTLSTHLIDKLGEGLIIKSRLPLSESNDIALSILQASRMRSFKTEFISCPSCGRTLFDIQKTTETIKKRVGHLPGVSIAIMGCIVNGIGEMADADFGYVGGAPTKVDLYVKKKLVERNVPHDQACDRLIELIKQHGKWVDP
ncbi:putative 4-hydroxy-3-methylbut-2-en-1-yl diphosphate synthase [Babesia sp. Xinjiang]|uniref:putative 4-hydroxy-3-methylbut-2-en-1-yl diphosphate synthase n=1 Tax=Babesia sp. Xinjiang TaxID=462227 RepID=UPI000A21776C|nr:putative 4-hydroxy-3-methylbut-2-en-1-yl diphosphate synthase [Babesia sp. Xinjiang]XP_028871485.1 putative 4-hydroxy-3-methylbut-2-en-1-yl diphosphate synthase [Babesia sp. Xinjiang]ORM40925.1 putative 4-hydroxy-3-methylbut-2-en-1-yl diphosphate synthase [Babesia sp. Xinjiang]ORM41029.1 putative 4-hydroxy-3-methylbut-2-en-1-yl diphosphate synthase [Babesia sp. Xinjiang]